MCYLCYLSASWIPAPYRGTGHAFDRRNEDAGDWWDSEALSKPSNTIFVPITNWGGKEDLRGGNHDAGACFSLNSDLAGVYPGSQSRKYFRTALTQLVSLSLNDSGREGDLADGVRYITVGLDRREICIGVHLDQTRSNDSRLRRRQSAQRGASN